MLLLLFYTVNKYSVITIRCEGFSNRRLQCMCCPASHRHVVLWQMLLIGIVNREMGLEMQNSSRGGLSLRLLLKEKADMASQPSTHISIYLYCTCILYILHSVRRLHHRQPAVLCWNLPTIQVLYYIQLCVEQVEWPCSLLSRIKLHLDSVSCSSVCITLIKRYKSFSGYSPYKENTSGIMSVTLNLTKSCDGFFLYFNV